MQPKRPQKTMPGSYCFWFGFLVLFLVTLFLTFVALAIPPENTDLWSLLLVLWMVLLFTGALALIYYLSKHK